MFSFETINYRLRPAKAIERKMLCEAFARMSSFAPLSSFRYIGMGSTSFSDFILFHRYLGIDDLISIERAHSAEKRIRLNIPFKCIKLLLGECGDVLTDLEFKGPHIIWLDYDGRLTTDILRDIEFVVSSATAPSVVLVTVNAHPYVSREPSKRTDEDRYEQLKSEVGEIRIPHNIKGKDLKNWGTADVYYRIINGTIRGVIDDSSVIGKRKYDQLFHFRYEDGAKMLTIGGLITTPSDHTAYENAAFEKLCFFRQGAEPFNIDVPVLTFREMRWLDQFLPTGLTDIPPEVLPPKAVDAYAKLYRYFPMYAETDL